MLPFSSSSSFHRRTILKDNPCTCSMGTQEEDYPTAKKPTHHPKTTKQKLKILVLILLTNLLTFFIFSGPSLNVPPALSRYTQNFTLPLCDHSSLLQELHTTQLDLSSSHSTISQLHNKLKESDVLVKSLTVQLARLSNAIDRQSVQNFNYNDLIDDLPNEAKLGVGPHKLPLGFSPRSGTDDIYPSVGGGCLMYKEDLVKYMSYKVGGECPVDDIFAQRLMLKGCEMLPRRRCRPKAPEGYVEPTPLPKSLWSIPPDTSIIWDPYTCKNYKCLVERMKVPEFYDCKDCFDMNGREKSRWLVDNGKLDYGIDQVLNMKPRGTIRIGLDIGGGAGTFAARMKERNVTIVTTSMNLDGPFNSFITSRGLISLHVSVSQRLPFFENTLDIVHSMHILSNWIPDAMLEFTLFDIYRVLRPGGLFWLDHFFCLGSQLNATYVPMLDRIGFKKVRWNAGMKIDRGAALNEWYFSAILQKPFKPPRG